MKIGLALSGGGALGAAHIGILEEIEKQNIQIDQICGTSAGAIIGLLYASGGLEKVSAFFSDLDQSNLLSKTNLFLSRNSTIFEKIEDLLYKHVGEIHFYDLEKKFSCVATEITDGSMHVLSLGDPVKAVMASSAYPGVFPVQKIGSRHFVDGALTRNLPASVLKEKGLDFIVGSSLYSVAKFEKLDSEGNFKSNPLSMAVRSLNILQKELSHYEIANCDFCFEPPVHTFNWYDFEELATIKETGRKYAEENASSLLKKISLKSHNSESFWQKLFS